MEERIYQIGHRLEMLLEELEDAVNSLPTQIVLSAGTPQNREDPHG